MSAEGSTDVDLALPHFRHDDRQLAGWRALLFSVQRFERAVLLIAQGQLPLGRATLARLAEVQGLKAMVAKLRVALDKLGKAGILSKPLAGNDAIENRLFTEYRKELALKEIVCSSDASHDGRAMRQQPVEQAGHASLIQRRSKLQKRTKE